MGAFDVAVGWWDRSDLKFTYLHPEALSDLRVDTSGISLWRPRDTQRLLLYQEIRDAEAIKIHVDHVVLVFRVSGSRPVLRMEHNLEGVAFTRYALVELSEPPALEPRLRSLL